MSTSPSTVDALIQRASTLKEDQPEQYEAERRTGNRVPYAATVSLMLLSSDGKLEPAISVQTVNISRGGIGVVSPRMFHNGTKGVLQLPRSDGETSLVGVVARHCVYKGDMVHQTGFEFIPLPPLPAGKSLPLGASR